MLENHTKEEHVPKAHHVARSRANKGAKTGDDRRRIGSRRRWRVGRDDGVVETCAVNFYLTPAVWRRRRLAPPMRSLTGDAVIVRRVHRRPGVFAAMKIAGEELARSLWRAKRSSPCHLRRVQCRRVRRAGVSAKTPRGGRARENIVDRAAFVSAPISTAKQMGRCQSSRDGSSTCTVTLIDLLLMYSEHADPMTNSPGYPS